MVTQTEEQQAREFLKRAEIRTMKKDLRALREKDALKERDKIAKIKTLEEQLQELQAKQEKMRPEPPFAIPVPVKPAKEKTGQDEEKEKMKKILSENIKQERLAEKSLKNYAEEQERQQIFLLESQRLNFESQVDAIEKEKEPNLKLEKNKILIQKTELESKLKSIVEQEERLENEQKTIAQKSQETVIPSQKKSLEQRRWELEKQIQEIEKKRWALEKQIQDTEQKIKEIDKFSEQLVREKNELQDKILGADKSLRDIYSQIITRVEEKRRGEAQEQKIRREALQKTRAEEKEMVQREQWRGITVPKKKEFLRRAPENFKEKLAKSAAEEEKQRAKFLQDVENWEDKNKESGI